MPTLKRMPFKGTPLFERTLVNGLLLYDRFFDKHVGVAGIRIHDHVRRNDVRRIAEALHMAVRIDRDVELFTHAELELHAVLHGGIDLAQVVGKILVPIFYANPPQRIKTLEQMERSLASTDRIEDDAGIFCNVFGLLDFGLQRINSGFKDGRLVLQGFNLFLLVTGGKKQYGKESDS